MSFQDNLKIGKMGESHISMWFRKRGYTVLPVYEKIIDEGKGPQLFTPSCELVAPDMLVFKSENTLWIEAKYKTRFSWYGIKHRFVTGIDQRHYHDYCRLAEFSKFPVWLLFLHSCSETWSDDVNKWNAPAKCPVGLFGQDIKYLMKHESHKNEKHGRTGMVYWAHETLKLIAPLEEVIGSDTRLRIAA